MGWKARRVPGLSNTGDMESAVATLQHQLDAHSIEAKRQWWNRYLKGAIDFRGVPMATIRSLVRDWLPEHSHVDLACRLIQEPLGEDKLAGVLVLAEHVVPSGHPSGSELLECVAALFDSGCIADWNTCDWFCVKFMHGLLVREGANLAPSVLAWTEAPVLWRRRAALVSFVNLAPRGDKNWPGFTDSLLDACSRNVPDLARFTQTGIGWVLRELSKAEPQRVSAFVDTHALSREARRMALAKIEGRARAR